MKNIDEQIAKTQAQINQLTNKKKRLISEQKQAERKKRTKRLIERGAILESVISNAEDFSNEQLQALLIEIFSSEFAKEKSRIFGSIRRTREIPCLNKGALIHLNRCVRSAESQ